MTGDLAHTLVASMSYLSAPLSRDDSAKEYNAHKRRLVQHSQLSSPTDSTLDPESGFDKTYLEALGRWLKNRRFFVTQAGRIGIGPQVMKKDDLVAILHGSRVPIVLRQCRHRYSYFMVGQAYVDGIMFGEAFEAHVEAGTVDMRFNLV